MHDKQKYLDAKALIKQYEEYELANFPLKTEQCVKLVGANRGEPITKFGRVSYVGCHNGEAYASIRDKEGWSISPHSLGFGDYSTQFTKSFVGNCIVVIENPVTRELVRAKENELRELEKDETTTVASLNLVRLEIMEMQRLCIHDFEDISANEDEDKKKCKICNLEK